MGQHRPRRSDRDCAGKHVRSKRTVRRRPILAPSRGGVPLYDWVRTVLVMVEFIAFTLLLAIIAIYEVLPKHRQLRVRYSLGNKFCIAVLGFLSVIIIIAYAIGFYIQETDQTTFTIISSDYITISATVLTAGFTQLAAALIISGIFLPVFMGENARVRNDESLTEVLRDLFNRGEYATLTDVIEDNYVPLVRQPVKPSSPRNKSLAEELSEIHESEPRTGVSGRVSNALDRVESRFSVVGRARDAIGQGIERAQYFAGLIRYRLANTAEEASGFTKRVLSNEEFASKHPILNPDLGIRVIEDNDLDENRRKEITDQYLRTQLKTKNSLLHRDVQNNRNLSRVRYRIKPENRLLHALLSDCSRARELTPGKSIGGAARDIVREQGDQEHDRYLSRDLVESSPEGRHSDPVYIGIMFIDIMVREAFVQRETHHMWLREYLHLTNAICENYEVSEETKPDKDCPNDYSLLLDRMVDNMCGWLKAVEEMAVESDRDVTVGGDGEYEEFIRLDSINYDWGSNIPQVAATCLISCHRRILTTQKIPQKHKEKISIKIFTTCVELRDNEEESPPWRYSKLMIECVEEELKPSRGGEEYRDAFKRIYRSGVHHEVTTRALTGGDISDELEDILL